MSDSRRHPSRRPQGGWAQRRRNVELITAVIALTAAVLSMMPAGGLVSVAASWFSGGGQTTIQSPSRFVDSQESLYGKLGALPAGTVVWAAARDDGSGRFYPQDHACATSEAAFDCGNFRIGPEYSAGGERFTIYVLAVPASAAVALLHYQLDRGALSEPDPGMSGLPADVIVLTQLPVVRKPQ